MGYEERGIMNYGFAPTHTQAGQRDDRAQTGRSRLVTVVLVMALAAIFLVFGPPRGTAYAASIPAINQCNGTDNVGGEAVACSVVVTNNLNLTTGVTSSTVTITECHGAAHAPPTCTRSTTSSAQLVTSVTQCDGSGSGGGGTVACSVSIVNDIVGAAVSPMPATVNQCNSGTGGGGGTQPTIVCDPIGSTTNATVNQCNGSGIGGGGTMRVRCTVTPSTETSALPVTVDQCNGSGNGGGSTVTCTVSLTNNITTPSPVITPPVTPPVVTPPPVTPPVVTPLPVTPPPVTPPVVTPLPVIPAPVTPVLVTPPVVASLPVIPASVTPVLVVPTPRTPVSVTPAPVIPGPAVPLLVATPPIVGPPSPVTPVVPVGVTPPTAAPPATPPIVPTGKLAFTGADTGATALLALLLLVLGTGLIFVSGRAGRRLRKNA